MPNGEEHPLRQHALSHKKGGADPLDWDEISYLHLMARDYTAEEHKHVALDPDTKALLLSGLVVGFPHGDLSGLADDDHPHYYNATRHTKDIHDALGLDHGSLSGLTDDDHTQYLKKVDDIHGICFILKGEATTGAKKTQALIPCPLTISTVIVYSDVAPTGASLIADINKNGTTIFTTQGNRPEVAIGGHADESGTPNITSLAKGDRVSVDVDQVGSTVKGGDDLLVTVIC